MRRSMEATSMIGYGKSLRSVKNLVSTGYGQSATTRRCGYLFITLSMKCCSSVLYLNSSGVQWISLSHFHLLPVWVLFHDLPKLEPVFHHTQHLIYPHTSLMVLPRASAITAPYANTPPSKQLFQHHGTDTVSLDRTVPLSWISFFRQW